MVNWKSDKAFFHSCRVFSLLVHVGFGVYVWEVLASIDFDLQLVRRVMHGPSRPGITMMVYLLARYTTLAAIVVGVRICNVMEPLDCETLNYALHALAYSSVAFTSGLLFLRVVAISGRNKIVIVPLGIFYAVYWGAIIYGIYHSEAVYVPELFLCAAVGLSAHRLNTVIQFSFDMLCLVIMLVLLKRSGRGGGLWSLIMNQGVIYFICVSIAYLGAVIFMYLDLNDLISQIPNVFALLVMSICATRMQRGLCEWYMPGQTVTWVRTLTGGPASSISPVRMPPPRSRDRDEDMLATRGEVHSMSKIPQNSDSSLPRQEQGAV
ncbi:hypothetical protein AURDEDRAFT_179724 [Auricularia subglabra TFB-10046 SS5]|nr:hypothetical protein AURDEDRAFT_179724 [Auricularia subglabra TFB-10046 SS5]